MTATHPHPTDPHQKALAVNLDQRRYGTFAEIGAGQEVEYQPQLAASA